MQNFSKEELILQIKDLQEQLQKIKKQKKYGIVWEEKAENIDKNKLPMLEEDKELRIENDKSKPQNLIIEWDNFHALSVLQNTHKGKIDVIYIDPPYNTWKKDFIYNDDYVDKEDTYRHSKWLSFMQKRLELAKNLLKNDWVIFISIDDNEESTLKLLCDWIFGEKNFDTKIIWRKIEEDTSSWGTMKKTNTFRKDHEFIICYSKNKWQFFTNKYLELPNFVNEYTNPDNDPRWPYKAWAITMKWNSKSEKYYEIITPSWKKHARVWRITKDEFHELEKDNRIYYWKKWDSVPSLKIFINEDRPVTPKSIFENLWSTFTAKDEIEKLWFNRDIFDTPKPKELLKHILTVSSNPNSIILDFFAWSGTTWHAVLELNKEDGWNRQFILCSNRENTKENPEKNICRDITYERNKRVIQGYTNAKWEQVEGLGGNLRYYKTTFINKNPSIDDLRYSFIHKCDDLLCIKENTFTKVSFGEEIEEIKIFHNKNHFTVILYDMLYFAKAKEILELFPDKKISFYAFSMSKTMIAEEIAHIWKNIVLENIPDEILETYEKIFGL